MSGTAEINRFAAAGRAARALPGKLLFCLASGCSYRAAGVVFVLGLLALVFFESRSMAEEPPQLAEIESRVKAASGRLESLRGRGAALEKEFKAVKAELQRSRLKRAGLLAERSGLAAQAKALESRISSVKKRIKQKQVLSRRRVRAIYMHQPQAVVFDLISNRSEQSSFFENAFYLSRLRAYDLGIIRELADLKRQLKSDQQVRRERLSKLENTQQALLINQDSLEKSAAKNKQILTQLKQREAEMAQSVLALRAQALRLETVVRSLTDSSRGAGLKAPPKVFLRRQEGQHKKFEARGLSEAKRDLLLPVDGVVVKPFGQSSTAGFRGLVSKKGVGFSARAASGVRAVQAGRVIYIGAMPGYGMIVILDHGRRYYSLYGGVVNVAVRVGDLLEAGDALAGLGVAEAGRGNFYFEIRKNGRAVDPSRFYATRVFSDRR